MRHNKFAKLAWLLDLQWLFSKCCCTNGERNNVWNILKGQYT